jgi:phage FluMu protein Com
VSDRARYVRAWGDRRARVLMIAVLLAAACASLFIWQRPWIAGLCLLGAAIGTYGYFQFRCPRCRERFMSFSRDAVRFDRTSCQSCGLPKNASPLGADRSR